MPIGGKRAAAEQAGTFVEQGADSYGFIAPKSAASPALTGIAGSPTSSVPLKNLTPPVTNPAFIAASKSAVSTNVSPGPQVQGVKPSYSVTPGGPYTGGSLKI